MRESSQALAAFVLYRDMDLPRSLERLHQNHPKTTPSLRTLKLWSAAHNWQDRIRDYEQAIAAESAERSKEARLADADRRRRARLKRADKLRSLADKVFDVWGAKKRPAELLDRPSAVMRMVEHGDRTERLDTGEATERHEVGGVGGGPIRIVEVVGPE